MDLQDLALAGDWVNGLTESLLGRLQIVEPFTPLHVIIY